jgi:spermidine/putrescine-binding protein
MKRFIALVSVLILVGTACGSDDESGDTTAPPTTAGTTAAPGTTASPGTTAPPVDDGACTPGQIDGTVFELYNWSDYIDPELVPAFEAEYGVDVVETTYDSNETMLAQVAAGGASYDLIVPSDYMVSIMAEEGLLVPLQKSAISNIGNLDPTFTGLPYDPNDEYSVAYQWGTTGIGFSYAATDDEDPDSWAVIFDPAPGIKVSLLNDPRETMAAALKYLGYSVNTTSQSELDEAVELIKGAKDSIAKFDSDQFEDDLVAGEIDIAHGYSGDFFGAYDDASDDDYDAYEDFGYIIPKEGAVAWVDTMAIPTTSDAICTAHAFIDFILDAENGAALTNYNFYASPNLAATEFIDEEILEDETIYPSDEVFERLEFLEDTGDFELNYTDAFTEVKS